MTHVKDGGTCAIISPKRQVSDREKFVGHAVMIELLFQMLLYEVVT